MTEDFVVTLQSNFPATISTLFRISDKLKSNTVDRNLSDYERDSLCLLCLSAIEESSVCSASTARHISQTISRSGPDGLRNHTSQTIHTTQHKNSASCNSNCISQGKECCKTIDYQIKNDWSTVLCYGCRNTMDDVKEPELMPINYLEEIGLRSRRQLMRQSVEQFLL